MHELKVNYMQEKKGNKRIVSLETRKKMSDAKKGIKRCEETINVTFRVQVSIAGEFRKKGNIMLKAMRENRKK